MAQEYSDTAQTDFNPLQGFDFNDEESDEELLPGTLDDGPYGLPISQNAPKFETVAFDNAETADERIATLFGQMVPHTRVLMAILAMAQEPVAHQEVVAAIEQLQEHHHSVYAPATFCDLLDRAGALEQTNEEGVALKDIVREPDRLTIEGEDYWKVAAPPEVFWTLTDEGRAYYAAYQPLEQMKELYAEEPQYVHLYDLVLHEATKDGGATVKALDTLVLADEAAKKPKRYATYFVDRLERAGALDWEGTWVITDAGREFLSDRESA